MSSERVSLPLACSLFFRFRFRFLLPGFSQRMGRISQNPSRSYKSISSRRRRFYFSRQVFSFTLWRMLSFYVVIFNSEVFSAFKFVSLYVSSYVCVFVCLYFYVFVSLFICIILRLCMSLCLSVCIVVACFTALHSF